MNKIFIGADHRGFALKGEIVEYLKAQGYDVYDVGVKQLDPDDDFPKYARAAVLKLLAADYEDRAILLCSSGQGMCIAANRFKGIRATIIWDTTEARMARNDDDSNVLCLPARVLGSNRELWQDIIDTWLNTPFAAAARYIRRNHELDKLT